MARLVYFSYLFILRFVSNTFKMYLFKNMRIQIHSVNMVLKYIFEFFFF